MHVHVHCVSTKVLESHLGSSPVTKKGRKSCDDSEIASGVLYISVSAMDSINGILVLHP